MPTCLLFITIGKIDGSSTITDNIHFYMTWLLTNSRVNLISRQTKIFTLCGQMMNQEVYSHGFILLLSGVLSYSIFISFVYDVSLLCLPVFFRVYEEKVWVQSNFPRLFDFCELWSDVQVHAPFFLYLLCACSAQVLSMCLAACYLQLSSWDWAGLLLAVAALCCHSYKFNI